jgi:hypothetical protein
MYTSTSNSYYQLSMNISKTENIREGNRIEKYPVLIPRLKRNEIIRSVFYSVGRNEDAVLL